MRYFAFLWLGLILFAPGCSIKKMALNSMASTISEGTEVYASDDDPELVRDALPFALKTIESLLRELPENKQLLLAACSGFTQYSYAFIETDAMLLEYSDYRRAEEMRDRAIRLYLRARDYGLRGLEVDHEGVTAKLALDPEEAVAEIDAGEDYDLDLIYWTAAAWGSAVSLGMDRPELIADFAAVEAIMERVLALDEDYGGGGIHEVLLSLRALPTELGGDPEKAREHFERALELSEGKSPGLFVTYAVKICVREQNREEFIELLRRALAIDPDDDPDSRLQTIIVQSRARHLLENVDELFFEDIDSDDDVGKDAPSKHHENNEPRRPG